MLVLLFHYFYHNPFFVRPVFFVVTHGFTGVHLFFVLSGFLVGGILIDSQNSPVYFRTFFIRRICRIFPLYFACVLGSLCITGHIEWWQLGVYVLFLQNYIFYKEADGPLIYMGISWSLAVEEQFYLTLPLLIRFVPRRRLPQVLIAGIVAVMIIRYFIATEMSPRAAYYFSISRADALFLGVLAAWLWRDPESKRILQERRAMLALLTVVTLGGIIAMSVLHNHIWSIQMALVGHSVFSIFYVSLLLLVLTSPQGWLAAALRIRPLCWVGTVSYFLYMMHYPVLYYVHQWLRNDLPETTSLAAACTTLLAFVLTLILAAISWRIFEKRFIALGHRFTYK